MSSTYNSALASMATSGAISAGGADSPGYLVRTDESGTIDVSVLPFAAVPSRTYYVDSNYDETTYGPGSGSAVKPFKTIQEAIAANSALAPDLGSDMTIVLCRGTYAETVTFTNSKQSTVCIFSDSPALYSGLAQATISNIVFNFAANTWLLLHGVRVTGTVNKLQSGTFKVTLMAGTQLSTLSSSGTGKELYMYPGSSCSGSSGFTRYYHVALANAGAGAGVYKSQNDYTYSLKSLSAGSTKITVTGGTNEISIDAVPGNIPHQDLSGAGTNTHAQIDSHISSDAATGSYANEEFAVLSGAEVPHGLKGSGLYAGTGNGNIALRPASKALGADTISEITSEAGVTIDGLLIKDGAVTASKILVEEDISTVDAYMPVLYVVNTGASVTVKASSAKLRYNSHTNTLLITNLRAHDIYVDDIKESTLDTGVTVDGVLLKDGTVTGSFLGNATSATSATSATTATSATWATDAYRVILTANGAPPDTSCWLAYYTGGSAAQYPYTAADLRVNPYTNTITANLTGKINDYSAPTKQVVGARGNGVTAASAVSGTATSGGYGFVGAAEMNSFISGVNAIKDQLNKVISRLKATGGHGLIEDTES